MNAPDLLALRKTLRARLRGATGYPDDSRIQWENRAFTPPSPNATDPLWIREALSPGPTHLTSLGYLETIGIYWMFVHGPAGRGTEKVEELANQIEAAFSPKSAITGMRLHLYRTERQPGRLDRAGGASADGLWFTVPVLVYWRLFTAVE